MTSTQYPNISFTTQELWVLGKLVGYSDREVAQMILRADDERRDRAECGS